MSRKYSAGDVVLLTQKKEVKKGHHRINLNGIQYTVSSDFDGLLLVISYRADLGAYSARELHGSERRTSLWQSWTAIPGMRNRAISSPKATLFS